MPVATEDEIKDAALLYAVQSGFHAQRENCSVRAVQPKPIKSGIEEVTSLPVIEWIVTIGLQGKTALVRVKYFSGGIGATDLKYI